MIVNLWRYRGFIARNALSDMRHRYAGSAAGVAWNVINPLAQIVIYSVVFSQIMAVRMPDGRTGTAFALYLCAGLLPWAAFSECILRGTNAFIENAPYLKKLPIDSPWTSPRAQQWDGETVETWKRRHLRTSGARLFLDVVVRAVFTSEPRDLSFLYFLSYLKTGHGLEKLISIKGGAQESRFVGGAQRISNCMAEQLGGRVVLNCPVRSITRRRPGRFARAGGRGRSEAA